jgi:hypothetical protein
MTTFNFTTKFKFEWTLGWLEVMKETKKHHIWSNERYDFIKGIICETNRMEEALKYLFIIDA